MIEITVIEGNELIEYKQKYNYLIRAASDRNFLCSSVVLPFLSVLTATGVGPVP